MLPVMGLGDLGDGLTLAVVGGGWLVELGPPRKYDASNPVNIGPVDQVPPPCGPFPCNVVESVMTPKEGAYYPMTLHQRLYQWPDDGVPIRYGPVWDMSKPPTELPVVQNVWPTPVIAVQPPTEGGMVVPPSLNTVAMITEPVLPSRQNNRLNLGWPNLATMPFAPAPINPVQLPKDNKRFILTGITYDRLGTTPVAGCRVVVFWTENIGVGKVCVFGETVSDGGGNYSIQVTGRPVQVLAYLPGSPDRAGVSRNDLVEAPTNVFMREPTVADTPSGGRTALPTYVLGVN